MLSLKRILHPTDFSSCAQGALAYTLDLVARSGAELHVLHVREGAFHPAASPDPMHPAETDLDIRLHEMMDVHLRRFSQREQERQHIEYSLGWDRRTAPAILQYADAHRIDLVVLGTHGRRGVRRLLLGSVATEVLRESRCDVVTVRACEEIADKAARGGHILVPLDLVASPSPSLKEARAIAELLKAHLTLLYVIEPASLPVFSVGQGGTFEALMPRLRQAAQARLERLREEAHLPAETNIAVEAGTPALVIAEYVKEQAIGLVVMATRKQRVPKRFLPDSVAEHVVCRVTCPVWILKSHPAETHAEKRRIALEKHERIA